MQTAVSPGEFRRYAAPGVLGMIGISCYILADTFFSSPKGTGSLGLAALNIAIPAYNLMNGLGLMVGVGGATLFALPCAGRCRRGRPYIHAHPAPRSVHRAGVRAHGDVRRRSPVEAARRKRRNARYDGRLSAAAAVLRALFFVTNNIMIAFVRNDGEPGCAMAGMIAGSLFNIVFDWVFIFPCGLGMFGAALATGASPLVSLLVLSGHLRRPSRGFHLRRERLRPRLLPRICAPRPVLARLRACLGHHAAAHQPRAAAHRRKHGRRGLRRHREPCPRRDGHLHRPVHRRAAAHQPKRRSRPPPSAALDRHHRARHLGADVRPYFRVRFPITAVFNSEHDPALAACAVPGLRIYFAGFLAACINIIAAAYFSAAGQASRGFIISLVRSIIAIPPVLFALSAARRHRRMADLPGGRGARLRTQSALYPAQSKITRKKICVRPFFVL